ncbi:Pentatricopeptide repeat-containing protein [Platanthera guangdongensis]|uniref:Pentatricopeptide repeat-containing protein n=1 Tax=Platanthera guangdongensis TaxID=2320717 RepID=A0ABR2LZW8_9ASPA
MTAVHHSLSSLLPPPFSSKNTRLVLSQSPQKSEAKTSVKEVFSSLVASFDQNSSKPFIQESFSSSLELCASHKIAYLGQQIHARILKTSSSSDDGFLCTRLLFMYGKCGRLFDAQKLFDELPQRTIFSWNALIGGYASNGKPEKAVQLYWNMRRLDETVDGCTLASVLKACGLTEDLHSGIEIHSLAVKCGLNCIGFVANALVSMYAKCGQFEIARKLFEWMPEKRDVVLWNCIISGCVQTSMYFDAIFLFRKMHRIGMRMNSFTSVSILQACTELYFIKLGKEVHCSLLKYNRSFELYELNALMVMYTRNGRMSDAVRLFDEMNEKDNVSWNSLLSGYIHNFLCREAVELFYQMLESGYQPDEVSLVTVTSALGRLGYLLNGKEIHGHAVKRGLDSDLQMGNTLMDMYTKCGLVSYSKLIFHKIIDKDVVSWTTMIACYSLNSYYSEAIELFRKLQKEGIKPDSMMMGSILLACSGLVCVSLLKQIHGYTIRNMLLDRVLDNTIIDVYGECGEVKHALNIFKKIKNKDVVTWTSMITCCVHNRTFNDALCLFVEMMKDGVEPDVVTILGLLSATAGLASLKKGKEIHGFLIRRCLEIDGSLSSSLVDLYGRCGNIDESFKIFNRVRCKDLVLWTSIIDACGMHGLGRDAIELFDRMEAIGIVPDHITFLSLLYACSHSRLTMEGKMFFKKMIREYKLNPWPEHYACVVDLLSRAGELKEAYEFIRNMPIKPTAPMWCALLGACQVYSNYELGELAAQELLELEPENPGNHVLISNTFAAMGKWKDVKELRLKMMKKGLKKDPACSWIEVGSKINTFVARDNYHEDLPKIHAKLAEITRMLEEGGYIADTSFVLHDVGEEEKIKMLQTHSERLAIAFGLIHIPQGSTIRITKNLRVCGDCHVFTKLVSKMLGRDITPTWVTKNANLSPLVCRETIGIKEKKQWWGALLLQACSCAGMVVTDRADVRSLSHLERAAIVCL